MAPRWRRGINIHPPQWKLGLITQPVLCLWVGKQQRLWPFSIPTGLVFKVLVEGVGMWEQV